MNCSVGVQAVGHLLLHMKSMAAVFTVKGKGSTRYTKAGE